MALLQIGKRKRLLPQLSGGRIYISISSEGLGHSTRAIALASQFNGDEVLIGTYDYAYDRIKSFNLPCVQVPQEFKFIGADGTVDMGKTIFHNQGRALAFNNIVQEEMEIIKRFGISLVVADGRMAPVLAASRLDVPCIVLTNQSAFYPFFEQDSPLVKLFGRSFEWVMKFWLSSAEEILIPDFPPPYTVCLPNLSTNFQVKKRTRFVGPLIGWDTENIIPIERAGRPLIVVSLGGHQYRRPLFDAVLKVAKRLPEYEFKILTSFTNHSIPPNVSLYPNIQDCSSYFKAADLVITAAGHSTAMELLVLGIPSIVIPDTRQVEQENNAKRMVELGVSRRLEYDQLEERILGDSIDIVLWNSSYQERAKSLAIVAQEWNGAETAANILRDYAHRLVAY